MRTKEFIMSKMLRDHVGLMTAAMLGAFDSEVNNVFPIRICPEDQEKWEKERRERERLQHLSSEECFRLKREIYEKVAAPFREERARRKAEAWKKRQPKKKEQPKVEATFLKDVAFPECGKTCAALKMLGVCECESICGWKFRSCDETQSRNWLTQKELDELRKV
jgi:hypothetical protein